MTPKSVNRGDLRQQEADASGLSLAELTEIEPNRKDQSEAESLGIEVWEVRMRREGATEPDTDARREGLRMATRQIIDE